MFKAIREFRRETAARMERQSCPHDEAGRAVIEMTIHDNGEFLSPYSHGAVEVINDDTAEFIRNSALGLPAKEKFSLQIYSDCVEKTEQVVYTNAIHEYFSRHFADCARDMRLNAIQSVVLFAIGIVALLVMILAEQLDWGALWIECIDIFAWVFLWETVDLFFLERSALRRRAKRYLSFEKMEVIFHPLSDLNKTKD